MAYVKFLKGTPSAYESLSVKDENTLYFIFEEQAKTASLYLGDILVAGGAPVEGAKNLSDLEDILFDTLSKNDILIYDGAVWKNIAFEDLIKDIQNNFNNYYTKQEVEDLIDGFEADLSNKAEADEVYTKDEIDAQLLNKANADEVYTKDEINTQLLNKANADEVYTSNEVDNLLDNKANKAEVYVKNEVYTKAEVDSEINEAIVALDHLKRIVVDSVNAIDPAAENAELYIYMVPTANLEDNDSYDEYMVINGTVEKMGSWHVDLSDYATKEFVNKAADAIESAVDIKLAEKANKANTLAGYGITDAYTKAEADKAIADKVASVTGGESAAAVKLLLEAEISRSTEKDNAHNAAILVLENKMATIAQGAEVNTIQTVEENEFNLLERNLSIKKVAASKITGLAQHEALTTLGDAISTNATAINNVTNALNNYVLKTVYDEEIAAIKNAISWHNLT